MKSGCLARSIVTILSACGCCGAAWAQDAPTAITVTAARTTDLEALGGIAIDATAIVALQPVTALDALDRVAGVRAFSTAGVAGGTFVSVRGGKPNYTLVLLDGVKVSDPTNAQGGSFDLAQIDPALIERIEVYRGALSAVHGADALSGVVGIRLREPVAGVSGESARVAGSSAGEIGGDVSATLGWDHGGLLLGAGAYDSGSLDDNGHLRREQGLARAVGVVGGVRLDALGLYSAANRRGFPEESGGTRLAVSRAQEIKSTGFGLASLEAGAVEPGALAPTLRLNWSRQDVDDDTPAIARGVIAGVPRVRAVTNFERLEADLDLKWTHGPLTLAGGGGYRDELGNGHGFVDFGRFKAPANYRLRRELASGYVEATLKPLGWATLTGSARYDAPSTAHARWTGRAALRATPVERGPAVFVDYSEGFKLPSIYVLAYPLIANPRLLPETSRNVEAGLDWTVRGVRARVAAFATRYANLIDFDAVRFREVNRSRADSRGVEGELSTPLGRTLRAEGSVTYTRVTSSDGPSLRSRPEWQGNARLMWTPSPRWSVYSDVDAVSSFYDLSVPTGQIRARGHSDFAVGGAWGVSKHVAVDVVFRNLGDSRYEDAVGFPAPGRTLRIGLRLTR